MFAKAYRALLPGGGVFVSDMMLQADKTQPAFSTLFSLQMLLTSREGAVFSVEECKTWLEEAGFTGVSAQALPPPLPYTVVTAWKADGVME
jgi:8-O-methyltransferase